MTQAHNHQDLGLIVVVQFCLVVILMVISFGGNATVGALLMRFRNLRTIPNILIANTGGFG